MELLVVELGRRRFIWGHLIKPKILEEHHHHTKIVLADVELCSESPRLFCFSGSIR
jgi:hypothetical protein